MLAFWDRPPTRFAGARKKRRAHSPRPSARHGGTRRPYRAQPGGSLWMGGYQRGASANWSMNLSRARSRRGATTLLRRSEAPAIGRARGNRTKRETRDGERTELGGGDAGRESGRRTRMETACIFLTGGDAGVLRVDGIWFSGRCLSRCFRRRRKKPDNPVQLVCSITSEPLASLCGGSRLNLESAKKGRKLRRFGNGQ